MTKLFEILDGVRPLSQPMLDEVLSINTSLPLNVNLHPLSEVSGLETQ
jgi:hypothetical protein